jgi:integrase
MPNIALTVLSVRALKAKPTRLDYWDTELPGFGLRVSVEGRKSWQVRYRVEGHRKQRRLTLKPPFPRLSLADAREQARKALRQAADGIDPAEKKQERRKDVTFAELAADYMKRHANPGGAHDGREKTGATAAAVTGQAAEGPDVIAPPESRKTRKGKKSWKEDRRIINNELLAQDGADWGRRKADEITRGDTQALHDHITDRDAEVMANRVVALASKIFNHGIDRGLVEKNPAHRIKKNDEESRARVLTDNEIRGLWAALQETERKDAQGRPVARLNATLNDAFRMDFYTMQRGAAEVCTMRWPDVDLVDGWWEIPGLYTKNGQLHRVPLSTAAVGLLARRLQTARPAAVWVFENVQPSKNPTRRFGNVRSRGKKAAAFLSMGDAHLKNKRARTRKRPAFLPGLTFRFQRHDIRRTASTNATKAEAERAHVSLLLNHIDRGPRATRVYDRYEYDREKRAAMEIWARKLDAIINGSKVASVIPFAQAR